MRVVRTTIALDDNVLDEAKRQARARGMTLGAFVEDALRTVLARRGEVDRPVIPVFRGGTGPRPGVDLTSNRALFEVLAEGAAPDTAR